MQDTRIEQTNARREILATIKQLSKLDTELDAERKLYLAEMVLQAVNEYLEAEETNEEQEKLHIVLCLERAETRLKALVGIEDDSQRGIVHSTLKDVEKTLHDYNSTHH